MNTLSIFGIMYDMIFYRYNKQNLKIPPTKKREGRPALPLNSRQPIEQACDLFANQQIQALQYLRFADMPVKRVFFPLHKAMDGFMNAEQYERLYWKPLKKIMTALIEWGVTACISGNLPIALMEFGKKDLPHRKYIPRNGRSSA